MYYILFIILFVIIFPAYLNTGKEIVNFLYTYSQKYTKFDFSKKFWKVLKYIFIFTWFPVLLVLFSVLLTGYFIYRGIKFYKGAKVDAQRAWNEIKIKYRSN